ncbi:MAG: hypothetical protein V7L20_27150 [Nostoc sp.]|uniref:hypothetical protein n=1 Tax=Nostoc sp. TaxID=1180 RepID=UPI002FFCCBE4
MQPVKFMIAKKQNELVVMKIEQRALKPDSVVAPCLSRYKNYKINCSNPIELLDNLTFPFLDAADDTQNLIENKMRRKWENDLEKVSRSVTNSLLRSAGTNYQTLVSYALAKYLITVNSSWYLQFPVPKDLTEALAIKFTAGIPINPEEESDKNTNIDNEDDTQLSLDFTETQENKTDGQSIAIIKPDVDIVLKNASWNKNLGSAEPILLLSVKTSLVDRAGQAARWKIYFDIAMNPCRLRENQECVYRSLGIMMNQAAAYKIYHGIVTANIYKIKFHDLRYQKGELNSGQTKSNTYMFEHKFTTRNDGIAITPPDWNQFSQIAVLLKRLSHYYKLTE